MLWTKKEEAFNPKLTFVAEVQAFLRDEYAKADTILEYGSGGSTALAASLGKRTFSVESDGKWTENMNSYLKATYPAAGVEVRYVDIGKTGDWGRPVDKEKITDYHRYPLSVWDAEGFVAPDVILIDGRFRVACFCAAMLKIERPTRVLWDDYMDRKHYKIVEKVIAPVSMVAKMAVFDLAPRLLRPADMTWVIGSFTDYR